MTEEKKTEKEMELDKREAELNKFKEDLLKVHEQLKPQAEMFNSLKEQGIETVDDLTSALTTAKKETETKPAEGTTSMPTLGDNSENEKLKKEVQDLKGMVQRQSIQMQTNRLFSDIKAEIKDKPEFALLAKGINENIAFNILRSQEADKQKGLNKPLTHYLQGAEKDLRDFYTQLGGKIEEGKPQGEQSTNQTPQASQDTSAGSQGSSEEKSPISFPSLPSHGTGDDKPQNDLAKKFQEDGKNPITGKYDADLAFNKFVADNVEAGKL